jgi:antitoxin MazE
METAIIKIGNSRGLRLSKSILEKYNIKEKVEIVLEKTGIVLKPIETPRKGWAKVFEEMHKAGDDVLLINDVFEDETLEPWK